MELSEEKLEWRSVKAVFHEYHRYALLLKSLDRANPRRGQQLALDFGALESIVDDDVIRRREAEHYMASVMDSVKRLSVAEQKIIKLSYMTDSRVSPLRIYQEELHVGRTLFYTAKNKAVGKLYVLFDAKGLIQSPDFLR
ncbi:hypothetical protein KQR54_18830 [Mycobacterium gordonae]|nr:hypothetical protein [Mycobacterium gordonae]